MPVQINELIIRASVEPADNNQNQNQNNTVVPQLPGIFEEELAEKIFEILKEKKER